MNQTILDAKNKLKKSVLYHMSLSSKELFRSDFWEWLINYDNDYAKAFFSKYENEEGKIYCTKRGKGRALEGKWEFPGGKVEINESHEDTIIREIKEELDSTIKPIKYLGKSYYEYKDIKPYADFSITLYAYKCKLISGDLCISEHSDAKWLSFDEMKNYDFVQADKPFIK